MQQGSKEWYDIRCGKVTGSCFDRVLKGRQTAATYMSEVLGERLTGKPSDEIKSKYLDWGNKYEPDARAAYALKYIDDPERQDIVQTGFVIHREHSRVGCSPDSLVGENGLAEIKCPYTPKAHLKTLTSRQVPKEYVAQVQGNMWVCERDWCDFISYHPDFPRGMRLCCFTVPRDEAYIKKLSDAVLDFCDEIEDTFHALKDQYPE